MDFFDIKQYRFFLLVLLGIAVFIIAAHFFLRARGKRQIQSEENQTPVINVGYILPLILGNFVVLLGVLLVPLIMEPGARFNKFVAGALAVVAFLGVLSGIQKGDYSSYDSD